MPKDTSPSIKAEGFNLASTTAVTGARHTLMPLRRFLGYLHKSSKEQASLGPWAVYPRAPS